MELHRNDRNGRKLAYIGSGYGTASLLLGGLFALVGGRATVVSLLLCVSGGFFLLIGFYLYLCTRRRFRLVLDHAGAVVHAGTCDFEGPWTDVDAVTLETVALPHATDHVLVLWLPDRVPTRRKPRFPGPDGRRGHRLITLEELVEPPELVRAALERYAGPRFRTLTRA
ncbi:hypothetical protein [Plantactinospora sp. GCM10030261]|uniref:hypothetical protein n=1 Tax=Plantactinospora sp. GCM10030261 TaxID=3273420 RepID=UPI00361AB6B3